MPERIFQSKRGTIITCDVKDGRPVNLREWVDRPIVLHKLSDEEILDIMGGFANSKKFDAIEETEK